jgi:hypothetical protein
VLSRRGFLIGGAAATVAVAGGGLVAVETGALPGRVPLGRRVGDCNVDAAVPDEAAGPLRENEFTSAYRHRPIRWMLALPPGHDVRGLPVALVLHGRGGDARTAFDKLAMHRFLAQHVKRGGRPFALATIDGGTAYWHPRASGDDPLGMLVHELLPRLRAAGLRTERVGALGWSMGGYGALLLARQSHRGRLGGTEVVAASAASPALFASFATASDGAFDGPADFARWGDLLAHPGVSSETILQVSCGSNDTFRSNAERYRAAVHPTPRGDISRGCHDAGYWRSRATAQLAFLGAAL